MVCRQMKCAPISPKGKRILALLTVKTCYIREALLWRSFSQFYLGNRILQLPESQRRNICLYMYVCVYMYVYMFMRLCVCAFVYVCVCI